EEVAQEFLLKGLQQGFVRKAPLQGPFRHYLKTAVRNAALSHLHRRRTLGTGGADLADFPTPGVPGPPGQAVAVGWRRCLLDRALQALDNHQRRSPGNLFHTVLSLALDHPDDASAALAGRASSLLGRTLRADAFRKQLSRARRFFADLLVQEVAQTL